MEKWHEPQTITFWLIITGVLVFLLVFSLIRLSYLSFGGIMRAELKEANLQLEHQGKLLETSILAQEEERNRIAADLHDALIGKLISLQLRHALSHDPMETARLLEESIAEARRISHNLSPPFVEHRSPAELVALVLEQWNDQFTLSFYEDLRVQDPLPADVKMHLLRIVQELMTNVVKHAQASRVGVHLRHTDRGIALLVQDNGRGFDRETSTKGLGTYSLSLRVNHLKGSYRLRSAIHRGTSALVVLPVPANETV